MGCTCKIQWGEVTESELSNVILKVVEEKAITETIPFEKAEEKPSPTKSEDFMTLKPDYLFPNSPSHGKINSPNVSKIDFSMTCPDIGEIIQEGELKKYRPGFTNQYITRWCVLTNEYFMYYKNRGSAQIWKKSPLFSVPIHEISSVSKVNFKIPGIVENNDQFEIFLKHENAEIKVSRQTDKTPILRSLIDNTSVSKLKMTVVKGMLMKRPLRPDSPEKNCGEMQPVNAERVSWSIREVEWFTSEKRLLFVAENSLQRDFWIMNIRKSINS